MERFFRYLGIGAFSGIVVDFLSFFVLPGLIFVVLMIPVILAILGALIGGYWKHDKGAWIGGAIMGLASLILYTVYIVIAYGGA